MPAPSPHARRLRRDQTDVEQRIWLAVRDRRLAGLKFRRQHTIGPFIVDFACLDARVAVELDGGQHDEQRDARRTVYLEAQGWTVLRFWNSDVIDNLEGVLTTTIARCEERLPPRTLTQPSPANAGEG